MPRPLQLALFALLAAALAGGCRVRVRAQTPPPTLQVRAPAPPPAASMSVNVQTQGTVQVVNDYCDPGAPEQCNGLDDNCDGVIDEGCGYQTGDIQITLAWATGADLDLYVTDPSGYTISFQNPQSPSGGQLDHDARGACNQRQMDNTVENVFWPANPLSGQYRIEVHYWGDCGVAGITDATLSIAVGGQVIGAYQLTVSPRERQPVALFDIP